MDGGQPLEQKSETTKSVLGTQRAYEHAVPYKNLLEQKVTGIKEVQLPNSVYNRIPIATVTLTGTGQAGWWVWQQWASFVQGMPPWITYVHPECSVTLEIVSNPCHYGVMSVQVYPRQYNKSIDQVANLNPYLIDINEGGIHEIEIPYMDIHPLIPYSIMGTYSPSLNFQWDVAKTQSTAGEVLVNVFVTMKKLLPRGVSQMADRQIVGRGYGPMITPMTGTILAGAATFATQAVNVADVAIKTSKYAKMVAEGANYVWTETTNNLGAAREAVQPIITGLFGGEIEEVERGPPERTPQGLRVQELETESSGTINAIPNVLGSFATNSGLPENYNTSIYPLIPVDKADNHLRHKIRELYSVPQIGFTIDTIGDTNIQIPVTPIWNYFSAGGVRTWGLTTDLNYFSQLFAFWRGGIRYKFKFFSSAFISYKVRIRVSYNPSAFPVATAAPVAPQYWKEAVINGSTEIDIEVPYLRHTDWISTGAFQGFQSPADVVRGTVTDPLVGPIPMAVLFLDINQFARSSGDLTPEALYNVIVQPMEDFQLKHYYPRKMPVISQMLVRDMKWKSEQLYEGETRYKRYAVEEDEYTIEDLTRRWSYFELPPSSLTPHNIYRHYYEPKWYDTTSAGWVSKIPNDVYLVSRFLYIRGNFDIKLSSTTVEDGNLLYVSSNLPYETNLPVSFTQPILNNGAVARDIRYNDIVDTTFVGESPCEWFALRPIFTTVASDPIRMYMNVGPDATLKMFTRGGANLQLAFLRAPPFRYDMPWYLGVFST